MNEHENGTKPTVTASVENLQKAAANIKDSVTMLVDQGGATVDAITSRVAGVTDQIKDGGASAVKRTTTFVEANPFKALAIAFGVGYVAMRIRTSPLVKLAMIGGLVMLGAKIVRR